MKNAWSEQEAAGLSPLDLLVYQSRLVGGEPSLALWGGGNTSLKTTERDFLGVERAVMRIKGSGADMRTIGRGGFPGVLLEHVLPLLERDDMADDEMVDYLSRCLLEPGSPRPSIETLLHAFLPQASVVHSHADAILSITNTRNPHALLAESFGDEVAVVEYRRPGFLLSKEVALSARSSAAVRGVALLNHGLVTWGDTPREAYDTHIELVTRAEDFVRRAAGGRRPFRRAAGAPHTPALRRRAAAALAPTIRGLLARHGGVIRFEDGDDVMRLVRSPDAEALTSVGAATPDHLLTTKRVPLFVDAGDLRDAELARARLRAGAEAYAASYREWYVRHTDGAHPMLDPHPRVALLRGVGMWTAGADARAARAAADIYRHTIGIMAGSQALDRYESLSLRDAYDAEYWPLELYKRTLAPPERELSGRVALVTGAASGIGRAIALRFAEEGAHVVVTDVQAAGVRSVAREIAERHGEERVLHRRMDVSDEESVREAFQAVRLAFGGLDVLVSNAGIALTGSIDSLELADWERSLSVNATGHFLVAREAVAILREQGLGGSLVFIATKNVPAPGQELGAYSAAKAAEAQLARVLAIENGPHGIRSNVINPDAVFRGSRLWSPSVRRDRAKAHGIRVSEVEEFYRRRTLLRATVTAEDVAEAALFLAGDRSQKTTGAMLPVDGGLREAFPR